MIPSKKFWFRYFYLVPKFVGTDSETFFGTKMFRDQLRDFFGTKFLRLQYHIRKEEFPGTGIHGTGMSHSGWNPQSWNMIPFSLEQTIPAQVLDI